MKLKKKQQGREINVENSSKYGVEANLNTIKHKEKKKGFKHLNETGIKKNQKNKSCNKYEETFKSVPHSTTKSTSREHSHVSR